MLNDINGNLASNILNSSLSSNQSVAGVTNALKNAYGANTQGTDLVDEGKISKEALEKYQTEQKIKYYKSIVAAMLGEEEEPTSEVSDLLNMVKAGNYKVDDSTLAKSILKDTDAKDLLG